MGRVLFVQRWTVVPSSWDGEFFVLHSICVYIVFTIVVYREHLFAKPRSNIHLLCHANMNRYHEGQMHSGTLIVTRSLPSDFTYTGTFLNNDFHGIGTIVSQNGSIYQGELAYGQYHGLGTLRTIVVNENVRDEDDNHYRESGSSGGQGHTMSSPSKKNKKNTMESVYIGDFSEGVFHGHGSLTHSDGSSYIGT